jgi:hypothetical protein
MKGLKKFFATVSMATLVAASFAPAAFAAEVDPATVSAAAAKANTYEMDFYHPFTDVGSRYEEAVSFLYEVEIIKGKTDTTFGTHQNLTRGDAAVILANALGLDTEYAPDAGFKDLNSRIKGSVNALADAGIVSGVKPGVYAPNEPLSRGAMAKFLVLGFGLEDYAVPTPFTDAGGVFAPYIEALYGTEITFGKTETSYGTHQNITRGDFANLLYRTFLFMFDNEYLPYAESVTLINSTSFSITLTEAVPAEYTARNVWDMFYVDIELEDGTSVYVNPSSLVLSADRTVLTVDHRTFDLNGKSGTIWVDDIIAEFDYTNK